MKARKIIEKAASSLELPPEVALGVTKLIITGCDSLKAVNHRGILAYETERIIFKTDSGSCCISGSNLGLAQMTAEYLRIEGRIDKINLAGEADEK